MLCRRQLNRFGPYTPLQSLMPSDAEFASRVAERCHLLSVLARRHQIQAYKINYIDGKNVKYIAYNL